MPAIALMFTFTQQPGKLRVVFFAALQLVLAPLTYVLHDHCNCSHTPHRRQPIRVCSVEASSGQSSRDGQSVAKHARAKLHCPCPLHSRDRQPNNAPADSRPPHDSDSCQICRAAFSVATRIPPQMLVAICARVEVLPPAESECLDQASPLYQPARGPPQPVC